MKVGDVKGCTIGDGIVTSKVVWSADRVTVTADQMLAAGAAGGGSEAVTAKTDCVEFLRQVLAAGPKAYTDLEREARNAGLLEDRKSLSQSKPFRAARGALGINPSQPKGARGWSGRYRGIRCPQMHQMPSLRGGHLTARGHLTRRRSPPTTFP
jgi:hypothetical protein